MNNIFPNLNGQYMKYSILADVIEWDVINWSSALQFWEAHTHQNLNSVNALEIGARNGGLSLWLALKGSHVLCTDLDGEIQSAHKKHEKYQVAELIQYAQVNALDMNFKEQFDVIVFKSVLGGVGGNNQTERQATTIKNIYSALKPGGELFFVENLSASPIHKFFRNKFVKWGNSWNYVTIRGMRTFLAEFSEVECQVNGFLGAFGRTETQRKIFGKIDNGLLNFIIPDSWKYIIAGVARK
jgi:SAM-dependent methyltransferase